MDHEMDWVFSQAARIHSLRDLPRRGRGVRPTHNVSKSLYIEAATALKIGEPDGEPEPDPEPFSASGCNSCGRPDPSSPILTQRVWSARSCLKTALVSCWGASAGWGKNDFKTDGRRGGGVVIFARKKSAEHWLR